MELGDQDHLYKIFGGAKASSYILLKLKLWEEADLLKKSHHQHYLLKMELKKGD